MTIPSSTFGVIALIALVLPGVVFAGVRLWVRGYTWTDRSIGSRVFDAVLVSVILDAIYFAVLGGVAGPSLRNPEEFISTHPQMAGIGFLILGVTVPAGLALVLHFRPNWVPAGPQWLSWVRVPRRVTAFESTPTAWDKAAPSKENHWVRIRFPDGERVAGWMGQGSYVATYPQSRDVYLSEQFDVDSDGVIGRRVEGTAGVWVAIPDGAVVEWLQDQSGEEVNDAR